MNRHGPRAGGKPSTALALLLIGAFAYFHFIKEGNMPDIGKTINSAMQSDTTSIITPAKPKIPELIVTTKETKAFNNYVKGAYQVALIEKGTELRVLEVVRSNQDNKIAWFKVKANGLNVWVKSVNVLVKETK